MRHRLVALLCAGLACPASAEFRATVGSWRYDLTGTVTDRGRTYDFQGDLGLEPNGRRSVMLELDTGPGWWPDWRVGLSQIGAAGRREETFQLMLGGVPIGDPETRTLSAVAEFDDADVAAQYPFGLGRLRGALGVAVKRLRGTMRIEDSEEPEPLVEDYDELVPQLRGQVRWPLGDAVAIGGVFQGVSYEGNSATEWRATAELRIKALLLEAGWQARSYEIAVGDYALDAQLDGLLLRGGFALR